MLASQLAAEIDPDAAVRQDFLAKLVGDDTTESVIGVALGFIDPSLTGSEAATPSLLLGWTRPVIGSLLYLDGFRALDDWGPYIREDFHRLLTESFIVNVLTYLQPVQLVAMPRPIPEVALGDRCHCGGPLGPGTFGIGATRNGVRGVLTAGHVSPVINPAKPPVAYQSNGNRVGTVVERMCYQFDRYGAPVAANTDVPDVTFIELSDQDDPITGSSYTPGVGKKWDVVTSYGANTTGSSPLAAVRCAITSGSSAYGNWAEAMFTRQAISKRGDSGAAVFNAQGEVVGQVVGGYPGVFTVIQDMAYLLGEIGAVL